MLLTNKNEFEKCAICEKRFCNGEKFMLITKSLWKFYSTRNEHIEVRETVAKCLKCYGDFE